MPENYLVAYKRFIDVAKRVADLGEMIQAVGENLRTNPANSTFSKVSPDLGEDAAASRPVVSVDWPSAAQIEELLAEYHEVKTAMLAAWNAVPGELRSGLQMPGEFEEHLMLLITR